MTLDLKGTKEQHVYFKSLVQVACPTGFQLGLTMLWDEHSLAKGSAVEEVKQ